MMMECLSKKVFVFFKKRKIYRQIAKVKNILPKTCWHVRVKLVSGW